MVAIGWLCLAHALLAEDGGNCADAACNLKQVGEQAVANAATTQKEHGDLRNKMNGDANDLIDEATDKLEEAKRGMETTHREVKKFTGKMSNAIQAELQKTSETMSEIEQSKLDLEQGGDDVTGTMDAESEEEMAIMEDDAEEVEEGAEEGTDNAIEQKEQVTEDAAENLQQIQETADGEFATLGKETKSWEKQTTDEKKEMLGELKETKKVMSNTNRELTKGVKVGTKIETQLDSKITAAISKMDQQYQADQTVADNTATRTLGSVEKGLTLLGREMDTEVKNVEKTTATNLKSTMAGFKGLKQQASNDLGEEESAAKQAAATAEQRVEKSADELERAREKLTSMSDQAQQDESKAVNELTETQTAMKSTEMGAEKDINSDSANLGEMVQDLLRKLSDIVQKYSDKMGKKTIDEQNKNAQHIKGEIENGQRAVIATTAALQEETENLEVVMSDDKNKALQSNTAIDSLKQGVKREQSVVAKSIESVFSKTKEDLENQKKFIETEAAEAKTQVDAAASDSSSRATVELASMKKRVERSITKDFIAASKDAMGKMDSETDHLTKATDGLVAKMMEDGGIIAAERQKVSAEIAPAQQKITDDQGEFNTKLEGIENLQKEKFDEAGNKITSQEMNLIKEITEILSQLQRRMSSKQVQEEAEVKQAMKGLTERASGMQETTDDAKISASKILTQLKEEFDRVKKKAHHMEEKAEGEKLEVEKEINTAKAGLKKTVNADQTAANTLQAALTHMINSQMNKEKKEVSNDIKTTFGKESKKLSGWVAETEQSFKEAELGANEYTQRADGDIVTINGKVNQLRKMLATNEEKAKEKDMKLKNDIKKLMDEAENLKEQMKVATEEEKEEIQKKIDKLGTEMEDKIDQLSIDEQKALADVRTQASGEMKEEKDKVERDQESVQASMQSHEARVNKQFSRIDQATNMTHKYLDSFEGKENGAEQALAKAASDLDLQMKVAGDTVDQKTRSADTDNADAATGQLRELEVLASSLTNTEQKAYNEMAEMKSNMKNDLEYFSQAGHNGGIAAEQSLAAVEGSAVDLVAQWMADTAQSSSELTSTQARLVKVVNSTMGQMEAFKQRLADIRQFREDAGKSLHNDISSVKGELTGTMSETVNVVESMKADTQGAYRKMEQEQKDFDRMLVQASQLTSSHDSEAINDMTAKMYELESNHSRLMSWQKQFKHYTNAWREEVKRKLRELTGNIGSDEDQIKLGVLHGELQLQDNIRNLNQAAGNEVAGALGTQASQITHVVNDIQNKLNQVQTSSMHDEDDAERSIGQTTVALNDAQQESDKEMAAISGMQTTLQSKHNQFDNEVAKAKDTISGQLMLPVEGYSPENQKRDRDFADVKQRLGGLSVLQLQDSQAADDAGGADHKQDEVRALTSLNAQLRKENAALSDETDSLESRVTEIKKQLQAAGVPLTP